MDDGHYTSGGGIRLSTEGFKEEEVQILVIAMREDFGIEPSIHEKNREKNLSVDSAEWNTTKSIWCKNLESLAGLTFRLFVKGVHDHAKNAWPWNLVNIERVPEEQKLARRSPC